MPTTTEHKLHVLLEDFGTAMLVTRTAEGRLRARPMALAEIEADGTLWFASDRHSGKVEEIAHDGHVAVTMQSGAKFVSVSGTATAVDDRAKAAAVWKPGFKVWFPGGSDDPNLILLRVHGEAGEYWDNSGTSGVRYLIQAGKALLTGKRPRVDDDPEVHGKVEM